MTSEMLPMLVRIVLLRIAVPIAVTWLLVFYLRQLDLRWQQEAFASKVIPENPRDVFCKTQGLSDAEVLRHNETSSQPCWQIGRRPNGYLMEDCLACLIFSDAVRPAIQNSEK